MGHRPHGKPLVVFVALIDLHTDAHLRVKVKQDCLVFEPQSLMCIFDHAIDVLVDGLLNVDVG